MFCTRCGREAESNDSFCRQCGTQLGVGTNLRSTVVPQFAAGSGVVGFGSTAKRWLIRGVSIVMVLIVHMVWRELDSKFALSPPEAGAMGAVRGVVLGCLLWLVFVKTRSTGNTTPSGESGTAETASSAQGGSRPPKPTNDIAGIVVGVLAGIWLLWLVVSKGAAAYERINAGSIGRWIEFNPEVTLVVTGTILACGVLYFGFHMLWWCLRIIRSVGRAALGVLRMGPRGGKGLMTKQNRRVRPRQSDHAGAEIGRR